VNQLEGDIEWKEYLLRDFTETRDASKIVIKALNSVVETGKRLTNALEVHISLSKRDKITALEGKERLDTQLATILAGINALRMKVDIAEIESSKRHAEAENSRANLKFEGLRREVRTAREGLAATKYELELIRNHFILSEANISQLKKEAEATTIAKMKDGRINTSISGLLKRGLWFWKNTWTIFVREGLSKLRYGGMAAVI
jgi:hypothetical protein